MKQFGYHPSEQEIKNIIGKIDQDSNGSIELSEFLNFIERYSLFYQAKPAAKTINKESFVWHSKCLIKMGMG